MCLSNKNRGTANYTHNLKPKKAKSSEQREKRGTEKESNNEGEKKRQEVKEYKTCGGKHHEDC